MMQGKRHDLTENDFILEMGEYGKDSEGKWFMRVPAKGFGMGSLGLHEITEHSDGTITVSPSILCTGHGGRQWHGYLRNGIWEEA
jgi:hypothetical protein